MISLLVNLMSLAMALQTSLFSDTSECDRAVYITKDATLLISCGSSSNGLDQIIKKLNASTGAQVYSKVITFQSAGFISDMVYDQVTATAYLTYVNNGGTQFWSVVLPIGQAANIQVLGYKLSADAPPQLYWSTQQLLLYVVGAANSLSQNYDNGTQYFVTLPSKSGFIAAYNSSFLSVWYQNMGTSNQGYAVTQYNSMNLVMIYNTVSGNSWLQPFSIAGVPVAGLTQNVAVNIYLPAINIAGGVLYAGGSGSYQSKTEPCIVSFNLTTFQLIGQPIFVTSGPALGDIQDIFIDRVQSQAYIVTFQTSYQIGRVDLSKGIVVAAQALNVSVQFQTQHIGVDLADGLIWYVGWDSSPHYGGVIKDQFMSILPPTSTELTSSPVVLFHSSTISSGSSFLNQSKSIVVVESPSFQLTSTSIDSLTSDTINLDLQLTLYSQDQSILSTPGEQPSTSFFGLGSASLVPLVIAAAALLALIGITACICCFSRYKRRRKYTSTVAMDQSADTQFSATLMTAAVTANELSIPAYLEYIYGVDVFQTTQVAKGTGGSINNCVVMNKSKFEKMNPREQLILKNMLMDVEQMSEQNKNAFYQEVSMIWMLREQPQFVKMFGYSTKPATILLKFYPHGSLRHYLNKTNVLASNYIRNKRQVLKLAVELSRGIGYLHSKEFVHCDIKTDNVLLYQGQMGLLYPAITDFGISRQVDRSKLKVQDFKLSKLNGMSTNYAAPEVFQRFSSDLWQVEDPRVFKAGDTYALSMIIIQLNTGLKPWPRSK